ncbi:hypothetical protein PS15p_201362 [Mucor circinelloides]
MPSVRAVYNITPPRELEDRNLNSIKHNVPESSTSTSASSTDTNNISDVARLLKARLQYAQIKLKTGMSAEELQQIEQAFLCSPRQPRRPLPSEFPPTPASPSPHARRIKRLLLSAMTLMKKSWQKKKRLREQKKNELVQDETAARAILMLSSSSPSSFKNRQHRPAVFEPTAPSSPPPHDTATNCPISAESVSSQEEPMQRRPSWSMYKKFKQPLPPDDIYDAVSNVPNYEERSRYIGQALKQSRNEYADKENHHRLHSLSLPAFSKGHEQVHYNRPLPRLLLHSYKPPPPPMFGRPLLEDPFNSKPITHENVSSSPYSRSPPVFKQ